MQRAARLDAILGIIDKTLASEEGGTMLEKEELFEALGDFDPSEYEDEVKKHWGDTEACKESVRCTMDAVERHRLLVDTWFCPCSHEMHRGLGQMYVVDPRFAANYGKIRLGMAQYVCDAIAASATECARAAEATPRP